jgi:hypothetical protein
MVGFFALLLILFLIHYWYWVVALVGMYALGCWIAWGWRAYRAAQADRLRHERARRRIAAIELGSARAMCEIARQHRGEVIEGRAIDVRSR